MKKTTKTPTPQRRELIEMAGLGALASLALPLAAGAANAAKLPDLTKLEAAAALTHEPYGDARIYFEGPTDQLKSMAAGSLRLKAGMDPHPPHQHPEEEFMLVTEGTGEISVQGKVTQVGPGSMMYCAGNKLHGIRNTGKVPMMFYFFKWRA